MVWWLSRGRLVRRLLVTGGSGVVFVVGVGCDDDDDGVVGVVVVGDRDGGVEVRRDDVGCGGVVMADGRDDRGGEGCGGEDARMMVVA
ncbi:hypothetical protein Tco_0422286 [Tanacetum coccineum]|uniref:Uncharacterized protein n=1 Tax=Tanacetum coccineum TaxID=301880 RepID=A0ABQ5IEL9_9ASTR